MIAAYVVAGAQSLKVDKEEPGTGCGTALRKTAKTKGPDLRAPFSGPPLPYMGGGGGLNDPLIPVEVRVRPLNFIRYVFMFWFCMPRHTVHAALDSTVQLGTTPTILGTIPTMLGIQYMQHCTPLYS